MPRIRGGTGAAALQLGRVKLLFDENLSPRLIQALAADYPDCAHVSTAGLRGMSDRAIWEYAREHGFARR